MKKREEILDKYKWNVCDIYESVEDWRKDFEALKAMLDKAERFKGKLSDSNTLLQFYEYSKEQDILMDKVLIYVYLNHMLDVDNDKYNQMIAEVENLYNEFALKLS